MDCCSSNRIKLDFCVYLAFPGLKIKYSLFINSAFAGRNEQRVLLVIMSTSIVIVEQSSAEVCICVIECLYLSTLEYLVLSFMY